MFRDVLLETRSVSWRSGASHRTYREDLYVSLVGAFLPALIRVLPKKVAASTSHGLHPDLPTSSEFQERWVG